MSQNLPLACFCKVCLGHSHTSVAALSGCDRDLRSAKPKIYRKTVHPGIAENFYTWSGFMIYGAFYLIFISEINIFPFPFAGVLKTKASMVSTSVFITIIIVY